jgi:hypothetical protein
MGGKYQIIHLFMIVGYLMMLFDGINVWLCLAKALNIRG